MLDHLEAWDAKDIDKARGIWESGLVQLHEYVADMGRLHIPYKTATWLCGLSPNPFMRSPMPKPKQVEIDTLHSLLKALNFEVIEIYAILFRAAAETLATIAADPKHLGAQQADTLASEFD